MHHFAAMKPVEAAQLIGPFSPMMHRALMARRTRLEQALKAEARRLLTEAVEVADFS